MDPICITIMGAMATAIVAEAGFITKLYRDLRACQVSYTKSASDRVKILEATIDELRKGRL